MLRKIIVPIERIPVLIGKNGETKRNIEKETSTKIEISDDVTISGESVDVICAENIIKAIGRGFSPVNAMELIDEEKTLCVIPLPEKRNTLMRVRSRLIGTHGKARRNLERLTDTKISVYGKTVSIIGSYQDVENTANAVEKILSGAPHKNVYKFLEERKEERKGNGEVSGS